MARRPFIAVAILAGVVACSTGGLGGGCSCLSPIPGGFYQGPKIDDPIAVRLAPAGIAYVNQNWQTLIGSFVDGGVLHVPVPCAIISGGILGNFVLADQGTVGCSSTSCGYMDGKCDTNPQSTTYDAPADVPIQITSLNLAPQGPNNITATVQISINTAPIHIDTVDRNYPACLGLSPARCDVQFQSSRESPPYNQFSATVQLTIDTKWDKLLAFKITALGGTELCGGPGVPPSPNCLDPSAINLGGVGPCGDVWCGVANFALDYILPYLSPIIQQFVLSFASQLDCAACTTTADCLQLPPTASSTCTNKVCTDTANVAQCVPRMLGIQGRFSPAALLGKYGVPASAQLDVFAAAGASVLVDAGIDIGTRAGINAVGQSICVPQAAAPTLPQLAAPDFDLDAPDSGRPYHVALGISQPYMNLGMYEAQQSGSICLDVGSAQVALISTGTFKTFLPSLGRLATRDGLDAPMLLGVRPQSPPIITVGEGTYDPVTKQPIDPLLTISMPNLALDFYAMFDGRYARLFSLTADVQLPLSLIFNGCSSVEPALGDISKLLTNVRPTASEILAEDPSILAQLIPTLLGFVGPALGTLLQPFALPSLGGFQLRVDAAKGVQQIPGTTQYNYMGIYAEMLPAGAQCAVAVPTTTARLSRSVIPGPEQMHLTAGSALPLPTAVLEVRMEGMSGPAEFDYRVDQSMWHTFGPATSGNELAIADPAFLLQGRHQIDVRSRSAQSPRGISAPVSVGFLVDWEPPEVILTVDRQQNTLEVLAHDTVTPAALLTYSYAVGDQPPSSFGPARPIDLAAVDGAGSLTVRVQDEAGNIGQAVYRAATVAVRPSVNSGPARSAEEGAGCSTGAGGFLTLAFMGSAGWLWRRRRARS